jgi:hypothetical protein
MWNDWNREISMQVPFQWSCKFAVLNYPVYYLKEKKVKCKGERTNQFNWRSTWNYSTIWTYFVLSQSISILWFSKNSVSAKLPQKKFSWMNLWTLKISCCHGNTWRHNASQRSVLVNYHFMLNKCFAVSRLLLYS